MSEFYVVKNQDGYYASKQKEWLDGREPRQLFRSPHKDEAINMVFEMTAKDIFVRAETITCELDDKKVPIVEVTVPLVEKEPEVEPIEEQAELATEESSESAPEEPREETASERLSKMAARLREQQEA